MAFTRMQVMLDVCLLGFYNFFNLQVLLGSLFLFDVCTKPTNTQAPIIARQKETNLSAKITLFLMQKFNVF